MKNTSLPVGDLARIFEDPWILEMICRKGEHPFSEISESAYRRGFQHGMVAAVKLIKLGASNQDLFMASTDIAYDMRHKKKPFQFYLHSFIQASRSRMAPC